MARPAGRKNQRIQILQPVTTVDDYGQEIESFEIVHTCWSQIIGNGGGTGVVLNKGQVTYSHTVICHNCKVLASMNELWQIHYGSRIFHIVSIQPDDFPGNELTITCAEEKV